MWKSVRRLLLCSSYKDCISVTASVSQNPRSSAPAYGLVQINICNYRTQQNHMPRAHQLWAYGQKQTDINGAFSLFYNW